MTDDGRHERIAQILEHARELEREREEAERVLRWTAPATDGSGAP